MKSCRAIAWAIGVTAMGLMGTTLLADDYTLVPTGGAVNWQNNASWTSGTGLTFPNTNLDTANLSIGLTSNLMLDVGATPVTVGKITMGGTAGTFTSDVISTGGKLTLDNSTTNALIISGGVAGSTNRITAPVELNDNLDIDNLSNNNLTIVGDVTMNAANRTLTNNMATGPKLVLNNIILWDPNDVAVPKAARTITLSGAPNSRTEINGTFTRGDGLATANTGTYAFVANNTQDRATFVYNAAQTFNPGNQALQRSTYVLNNPLAFGPGMLTAAGAGTYTFTGRLVASNGNGANWGGTITTELPGGIAIHNVIQVGNSLAFAGSNNITLTGALTQGNNRAIGNAISGGASLNLTPDGVNNTTGISIGISQVVADGNRTWIFEGPGTTIVNGMIVNNLTDDSVVTNVIGNVEKRGTGRTVLNNPGNTMRGEVRARGGILVFGADLTWGNASAILVQANGGIWYTPGVGAAGWDTLLGKIATTAGNNNGFFALPASASSQSFDFSTGLLSTNATNMSIGADGNVTYTGTVTPNATAGYNWGGNSGTLTLGANASIGANAVTYKNGGTVVLTGTQSYTGITTLAGANMVTSQSGILTKNLHSTNTFNVLTPTVLSVDQVSNGGVDSTLGATTSDAANLVFDGGTLRYTGSGHSTDRLFTISTNGATLDSSGTGALQLTNTGSIVSGGTLTTNRTLALAGTSTADNSVAGVLSDPQVGNTLAVRKSGTGKWVLTGTNTYTGNTRVDGGILSISNPFLADASDVQIFGGALDLNFPAATPDTIDEFFLAGVPQAMGTWGAVGNASATFQTPFITGTGILNVSTFVSSQLGGDYNENGIVDLADYVMWREAESTGQTSLPNEGGISLGFVDQADYNYWRSRFGLTVVTGAALGSSAAVPEPASAMLAILALVGTIGLVNRRRRIANSR